MKFYRVDVFEKAYGNKEFPLASNFDEKCIGQVIIKKGIFSAKEIISGFELPISNNGKFVNMFNIQLYGRDLYIKKSCICDRNVVGIFEVEKYIDEFDYNHFCLNNEMEIMDKTNNDILKKVNYFKKNKRI